MASLFGDAGTIKDKNAVVRLPWVRVALCVALLMLGPAQAEARRQTGAQTGSDLEVVRAWSRATPNAAPTAVGYLTVTNHGRTADRLLGGETPMAAAIEPHSMSMAGGIMRMRRLPRGFEIRPGATLFLGPGSDHLMFIGPKRPFTAGLRIPAVLRFAHAGAVNVVFTVEAPAGAATAAKGMAPMRMP